MHSPVKKKDMKMHFLICSIVLFNLVITNCLGDDVNNNKGKCKITDFNTADYETFKKVNFNSDEINKEIYNSSYTGKLSITKCVDANNPELSKYVNISNTNTIIQISTTQAMEDFDKDMPSQEKDTVTGHMLCYLDCPEGETIIKFQFNVKDINTHSPTFYESGYTFKVSSPLMPKSDIVRYGTQIVVEDLEFSNQDVTFTIHPDDFDIQTIKNEKNYTAVFYTKNTLIIADTKVYNLKATDSGTTPGPLSSSVQVTLIPDESKSLDTPTVAKPSYSFEYQMVSGKPVLTPKNGILSVVTSKLDTMTLTFTGENSDKIKATIDKSTKEVTIEVDRPFTTTESVVTLTLSVKTDLSTSVAILIYMPVVTLEFDNQLFTGQYKAKEQTVTLDKEITLKSSGTGQPDVTLTGDESDYLETEYNAASKSYSIKLKKGAKIPDDDFKGKSFFSLKLTAKLDLKTTTANLIITFPTTSWQFSNIIYSATYEEEDKHIKVDSSIKFNADVDGVTVSVDNKYNDYIDISYNTSTHECDVKLKKEFSTKILETDGPLIVQMTATDSQKNKANAILEITVRSIHAPEFNSLYYQIKYPEDGKGPVKVPIGFRNVSDDTNFVIKMTSYEDDYNNNFELKYTNKEWQLDIKSPLDNKILLTKKEVIFTLSATQNGKKGIGYSALVVLLPEFKFTESVYTADYPFDGKGPISFKNALHFEGGLKVKAIELSDKSNFEIVETTSGVWQIEIKHPLDKITSKTEVILTMTAKVDSSTKTATATLIVSLPLKTNDGPNFNKLYYKADYKKDVTTIPLDDLELQNVKDAKKVTITVDSGYTDYLKIEVNSSTNKWEINILKPLTVSSDELTIVMTAKEDGISATGSSVLILKSTVSIDPVLVFTKHFYKATYPKASKDILTFSEPITFGNLKDTSLASITLEDHTDNFEISFNDTEKKFILGIKKALDSAEVNKNNELTITMTASAKGYSSGTATLVIDIEKDFSKLLKFKDPLYIADYPQSGTGDIPLDKLDFDNVDSGTPVEITLKDYDENFSVSLSPTTSKWLITIKKPLTAKTLNDNSDLRIIMTAKEGSSNTQSVLVLNLPKISDEHSPKYANEFYKVAYPINPTVGQNIDFTSPVSFTNTDEKNLNIILTEFKSNFDVKYNGTNWLLTITQLLADDIVKRNTELADIMNAEKTDLSLNGTGKAVLIIDLPSKTNDGDLHFTKSVYTGLYKDEKGIRTIALRGQIVVDSKTNSDKINVELIKDGSFDVTSYFELEKNTDGTSYGIKVLKALDGALLTAKYLTATLQAKLDSKTTTASLVLYLEVKQSVQFEKSLYKGHYDGKNFAMDGDITLVTDLQDGDYDIQISDSTHKDIFKVNHANNKVTIELTGTLPDETTIVPIILEAVVKAEVQSSSVLEIQVPAADSIKFEKLIYHGEYNKQTQKLEVTETITLQTNVDAQKIKATIEDDLKLAESFSVHVDSKVVSITLDAALPADKLKDKDFLSFTIEASIDGTTKSDAAVLNLKLISPPASSSVAFTESLYYGFLNVTDIGSVELKLDKSVQLTINPSTEKIELSILPVFNEFFTISQTNNIVDIAIIKTADFSKLDAMTNIVLQLQAKIAGSAISAVTIVNLEVRGTIKRTDTLSTDKVLYSGSYLVKDGHPDLNIDEKINIITNRLDTELAVELQGTFGKYFEASIDDKKLNVKIKDTIPPNMIHDVSFITLVIQVEITETKHQTSAVLNIKTADDHPAPQPDQDSDFDKTPYIVAISLLAVALVVLTGGAIAFYYFKMRSKDYTEVDEDLWRVKFDKSTKMTERSGSLLEQRRPTGFVFHNPPPEEESTDGSSSNPNTERRKSVLFNSNVEKMELQPPEEEDDEKVNA